MEKLSEKMMSECTRCGMEFTERCQMEGATAVCFESMSDSIPQCRVELLCWNCKHEAYRIWTKFMLNKRNNPDDRTIAKKDSDELDFLNVFNDIDDEPKIQD